MPEGESEGRKKTERNADANEVSRRISKVRPEPLPEGALLAQRRYEIIQWVGGEGSINEYEAVLTDPVKQCLNCHSVVRPEDRFCDHCGLSLDESPPQPLTVTIQESYDPEDFLVASLLLQEGRDPLFLAGIEVFEDCPYERRYYWVVPQQEGKPLSEVSSFSKNEAVKWILTLAAVVPFLSEKKLGLQPSAVEELVIDDKNDIRIPAKLLIRESDPKPQLREVLSQICQILLERAGDRELGAICSEVVKQTTDVAELRARLSELFQPPPIEVLEWVGKTDAGRKREHNEDSYAVLQLERNHLSVCEGLLIAAVADGMGGHAAGEVASRLALTAFLQSMKDALSQWLEGVAINWTDRLADAFNQANKRVYEEARELANNMGTTLVAIVLDGSSAYLGNVGDSRAYRFREERLEQITKDHSLVQQFIDAGLLTKDRARFHPQKNVITQAIGLERELSVDLITTDWRAGDLWLLCSDGLSDMMDDLEIEDVLYSELNLQRAAERLIQKANEAGGDDNITVILIRGR
ncbi:MAG: Stp1/IreP family PP2C-type Ser/Thr phosphatase [Armatimonadota bacterium]|nr:Stp1/IreP family PP2C-type Ser/Thr phosphatase [Armatimonadota bacterium]